MPSDNPSIPLTSRHRNAHASSSWAHEAQVRGGKATTRQLSDSVSQHARQQGCQSTRFPRAAERQKWGILTDEGFAAGERRRSATRQGFCRTPRQNRQDVSAKLHRVYPFGQPFSERMSLAPFALRRVSGLTPPPRSMAIVCTMTNSTAFAPLLNLPGTHPSIDSGFPDLEQQRLHLDKVRTPTQPDLLQHRA